MYYPFWRLEVSGIDKRGIGWTQDKIFWDWEKGSLIFFKSRICPSSKPTTAIIFSDLSDLNTKETVDPVGSAVGFEVMKLCNCVNMGEQWLVLGGTKSVYCRASWQLIVQVNS